LTATPARSYSGSAFALRSRSIMDSTLAIVAAVVAVLVVVVLLVLGKKRAPELRGEAERKLEPRAALERKPGEALPKPERGEPETREQAPGQELGREERAAAPTEAGREISEEAARAEAEKSAQEQNVAAVRQALANTRSGFVARLAKLFGGRKEIDKGLLEEIEEVLITADLGVRTTERMLEDLRSKMQRGELTDEDSVWRSIRAQAQAILDLGAGPVRLQSQPAVILMVGVNGVGKTTTIGKLASRYAAEGKKVLLAAGDTYRAAAVLQLEMWGKRVNCPVVKGKENADPGSVIFEAIKRAREEGYDLVIADTAGRLHTKVPLMEELKKIERTITKATDGRTADEVFLVLDSTTGQNAVQQMKMFRDALTVTGVVLTKLDGTAKGGVILGIVEQHKVPVRFIGLGERVEDLREFDPNTFVEAMFAKPSEATLAA
jgi:fused signal recognition particle receptor